MSKIIYKYTIDSDKEVSIPKGAVFLRVGLQNNTFVIWYEVDTEADYEIKKFRIEGTGEVLEDCARKYLGTIQIQTMMGEVVGHIYEIILDQVK